MSTIEVNDLWVSYASKEAVRGISLEVNAGQVIGVLGRNGAGKTSTVEAIEGYRPIAKGKITILGLDPIQDRKKLLPLVGVMLQNGGVYPRMSPLEVLKLYFGYYDDPIPVEELIRLTDLSRAQKTPYRHLSGGERQRLSLALALIGRPKVLFLDEPTAGVDAGGKGLIRQAISTYASQGAAILLTTHELIEAERICDEIVVIDTGEVVAKGSAEQLRERYGKSAITFRLSKSIDVAEISAKIGAEVTELEDLSYSVDPSASPSVISLLTSAISQLNVEIKELNAGKSSLEEVFIGLTDHLEANSDNANQSKRRRRRS
ncbi:ABC transporter ATP-binding protein [Acidithrix sp. C25]|uniref:ABC transporter ATP-binding protein n=1 Tax=Acidithrix sp. C25 TaxID=1671482 RepID=UPI00191BA7CE|nr:ABC transporter ATP-binding protein [Acidithrix sp. C25]